MHRNRIRQLQEIPNIGPAIERSLISIGIVEPHQLVGKDPYRLYRSLCDITGSKQDPCVLDILISAVRYMEGGPARKWWEFTAERKKHLGN
ncbi:MAG: helix-hairpin-helix domain-containing protein [Sedimenticola sp.]